MFLALIFTTLFSLTTGRIATCWLTNEDYSSLVSLFFTVYTVIFSNFYGLILAVNIHQITNNRIYNHIQKELIRFKAINNLLFCSNIVIIILTMICIKKIDILIFGLNLSVFNCIFLIVSLLINCFIYKKLYEFKQNVNKILHDMLLDKRKK